LQGGLYEFTRLALDLVELLDDSGKVVRFPIPLSAQDALLGGHADGVSVVEPAYETAQQGSVVGRLHVLLSAAEGNGRTTGSSVGAVALSV
jgi:hypothetical protein